MYLFLDGCSKICRALTYFTKTRFLSLYGFPFEHVHSVPLLLMYLLSQLNHDHDHIRTIAQQMFDRFDQISF